MELLYQHILSGAPAEYAQDMFGFHVALGVFVVAVIIAIVAAIYLHVEGFSDGWMGTLGLALVALFISGMISCINYSNAIEVHDAPEKWAAKKLASALNKALE